MLRRTITEHKGLRVLAVLLSIAMVSANEVKVSVTPSDLKEHNDVLLSVTGITERILFSEWYQGNKIEAQNQIIRFNNGDGSKNTGAKYFNKAEIFANASLAIKDFTKDLEGEYTVFIQGAANPYQKTVNVALSSPGLSVGAIVGIAIACIVAVAAIGVGLYFFMTKDSRS